MTRSIAHTDIVEEANRGLGPDEPVHKGESLEGVHTNDQEPSWKTFDSKLPRVLTQSRRISLR